MIGGFIDAYLNLDQAQERVFQHELAIAAPAEREAIGDAVVITIMELSNPWIRQGRQEGRQEGEATLVIRLLTKKVGALSPEQVEAIRRLDIERLEALAEAVFEIGVEADLEAWLK